MISDRVQTTVLKHKIQCNEVTAWYCVKSREVQSDTLHRHFVSFGIDVGMVKNKYVHHAIDLRKKHFRSETDLRIVAYYFSFF